MIDQEVVEIEIQVRPGGSKVLYVHIDGITVLRVNAIKDLRLEGPFGKVD
jgi:hypothetical protein